MNDSFISLVLKMWRGQGAGAQTSARAVAVTLGALTMLPVVQAQEGWDIVVPWRPALVTVDVPEIFARELAQELKQPVAINQEVYNQHDGALEWSLRAAEKQPNLVLFSEELALVKPEERAAPRHIANYEPLLLIWQTRWCLYVLKDSPLRQPGALKAWLYDQAQAPQIAIPEDKGRMSIWVKGMEQRTQRKWGVHAYGLRGGIVEPLKNGVDVAVSYCNRQRLHPDLTHIVAQSGPYRSGHMPDVPLLTEVGWLPLSKGWMGWLVPKNTSAQRREKMAQALYQVMGKPSVMNSLRSTGHVVLHMNAEESKRHIEAFSGVWNDVDALLSP